MKAKKRNSRGCGSFPVCGISVVNQKRQKIEALERYEKVAKSKEKNLISKEIRFFLSNRYNLDFIIRSIKQSL